MYSIVFKSLNFNLNTVKSLFKLKGSRCKIFQVCLLFQVTATTFGCVAIA